MPDYGICERFHRTLLDDFYRVAFRKKIYHTIDELQADLDTWLVDYNCRRPNQGRWCFGKSRVEMWRGGGRPNISVAAPHMGVIRSRGFVPSFSPFVSDPKSEPSVIRPGLPVLVST